LRLELENFKGVRKGSINIENLNILVGGNNSGKTTILESIFIAPNPLRDVLREPAISILKSLHSTLESEAYTFIFHNYTGKLARISCSNGFKLEIKFQRIGDDIEVYMIENNDAYFVGTLRAWGSEERGFLGLAQVTEDGSLKKRGQYIESVSVRSFISKMIGETIYFHPLLVRKMWEYFNYHWIEFRNLGLLSKIAGRISEGVAGDYDDLLLEPFIDGRRTILMRTKDGRGIRLGDMGSGVQTLITLMLLYEFIKPKMLLIDDIESHMNPSLLIHVTSWFGGVLKDGAKLVISTHSLEAAKFIAGSLEDYAPKITLITLRNGVLSSKNLTVEEVEELEKAGIDVRMSESILL
jgi:hypothetical protein